MTVANLPRDDLSEPEIKVPDDFEWTDVPDIMPGGTSSFRILFSQALSEAVYHDFQMGERGLQTFALVQYDDVFGDSQTLRISEVRKGADLSDNIVNEKAFAVDHPRFHDRVKRTHDELPETANLMSLWRKWRARAPGAISTTEGR